MAKFTFNLPDIGEGIAEAEIVEWHVKVGDVVEEDGRLADMMTDKATVEMESPVAGRVLELGGKIGEVVAIGAMLVVIEVDGDVSGEASDEQARLTTASGNEESEQRIEVKESRGGDDEPEELSNDKPEAALRAEQSLSIDPSETNAGAKVLASPAVRKRAKDLGISLSEVRPASEGRIRHADLDSFLSYGAAGGYAPAGINRADRNIKVVGLRRRIAENMAASKRNIPHFTYVEECDVTELERLRADLNEGDGVRPNLTMLPLLIAAVCRTLPDFPMINARYDDEANVVTHHGAVHMGMATMTEAGLMVPVIRNAHLLNLWQLAAEAARLAEAARAGSARQGELSGSTLTISSLGALGGVISTPVINRPEVAVLAPNRIIERPAFVPDESGGERIAKRQLMNLSISCDHRVVDGYDAAGFMQALKRLLEAPSRILAG